MQDVCLIHKEVNVKQIYLHMEVQPYHGVQQNYVCYFFKSYRNNRRKEIPTTLYINNVVCITQLRGGYIEGDRIKHISQKIFFNRDLKTKDEINVKQVLSSNNLADMFTKALPTSIFEKLRSKIEIRHLRDIRDGG